MKKRIMISLLAMISVSSFAWEINVKTGFDAYRGFNSTDKIIPDGKKTKDYEKGWTLGAEIIPYENKYVGIGAGFEYNFGTTSVKMDVYDPLPLPGNNNDLPHPYPGNHNQTSGNYQIPVYFLAKAKAYNFGEDKGTLYIPIRFGYSVSNVRPYSGLYYGAGIGYENGPFVVEALYNGTYSRTAEVIIPNIEPGQAGPVKSETTYHHEFSHRAGIRIGLKFGDKELSKIQKLIQKSEDKVEKEVKSKNEVKKVDDNINIIVNSKEYNNTTNIIDGTTDVILGNGVHTTYTLDNINYTINVNNEKDTNK